MAAPRAVFDCVIFVQAMARRAGPAGACWELARAGRVTVCLSRPVLDEIAEVLRRPKLADKLGITEEVVRAFLAELIVRAIMVDEVPDRFRYPRDPKDERYVNLAAAANATHLVTRDNDLLDLMRDDAPAGREFREQFPNLTILDPVAFLNAVRPKPPNGPSPTQPA